MSAEVALEAVLSIISDALVSGDKVQLVGFGTFESKERAARVGRNPRANIPVNIPAKRVPVFKPGSIPEICCCKQQVIFKFQRLGE